MKTVVTVFFIFVVLVSPVAAEVSTLRSELSAIQIEPTDLDRSLLQSVLGKSLDAYEAVKDYRAIFLKQELSKGRLGDTERIFLKFEKPFKIFMSWMDTDKKGLQVLYERGRHDGKLAIHKPGLLLGLAPVVFLEQDSPWVREGSESYDIEDAGIGTFLNDFTEVVIKALKQRTLSVQTEESEAGYTADTIFQRSSPDTEYFAYRVTVFFDKQTSLPIQMTLYDCNEKPMGIYQYENLEVNVGMDDADFKKIAQSRLYRLYTPASARPAKTQNFSSR